MAARACSRRLHAAGCPVRRGHFETGSCGPMGARLSSAGASVPRPPTAAMPLPLPRSCWAGPSASSGGRNLPARRSPWPSGGMARPAGRAGAERRQAEQGEAACIRRWRAIAQGAARPDRVVVPPPALDQHLGLAERAEDLPPQPTAHRLGRERPPVARADVVRRTAFDRQLGQDPKHVICMAWKPMQGFDIRAMGGSGKDTRPWPS